jgi:serine/threonine protein kinase
VRKGPQKSSLIQPGEDLNDDYRVGELLAVDGGMGLIYVVSHKRLSELRLVLKVLPSDSPSDMIARMEREAYALSKLSTSRYVVRIQDSGHCKDGMPYIVMDRLTGPHLGKLMQQEGPLDIQRAVGLGMQACLGLHTCHGEGIIHRDIKPANLMLHHDAQAHEVVKLIDFGISHVLVGPAITSLDKRSGTRRYMPPEQSLGNDDERADQFSLAAVIFETIAGPGQLPWPTPKKDDGAAHERFVAAGNYRRLRDLRSGVPEELEAIVRKALSPNPDDRFVSMHEFARELVNFADAGSRILFDQYIVTGKSPLVKVATVLTSSGATPRKGAVPAGAEVSPHDDSDYATVPAKTARGRRGRSRYAGGLAMVALAGLAAAWALRGGGPGAASGVGATDTGASKPGAVQIVPTIGSPPKLPVVHEDEERHSVGANDEGASGAGEPVARPDAGSVTGALLMPPTATSQIATSPIRQKVGHVKQASPGRKTSAVRWMKGRPYSTKGTAIVE